MLIGNKKLPMYISLLLALLLGIFVGINIKTMAINAERKSTQHARRTIVINLEREHWDVFFDRFEGFARKWRYAIRVAPLDPNDESYIADLWRADIRVTAFMNDKYDPGIIQIFFYDTDRLSPVPEVYFDEEIADLKDSLGEIPGITITEEQ